MDRQFWNQIEADFMEAHPDLEPDAFSVAVGFIEERMGRALTMDEFRMVEFFYLAGNRRGCQAMRPIYR